MPAAVQRSCRGGERDCSRAGSADSPSTTGVDAFATAERARPARGRSSDIASGRPTISGHRGHRQTSSSIRSARRFDVINPAVRARNGSPRAGGGDVLRIEPIGIGSRGRLPDGSHVARRRLAHESSPRGSPRRRPGWGRRAAGRGEVEHARPDQATDLGGTSCRRSWDVVPQVVGEVEHARPDQSADLGEQCRRPARSRSCRWATILGTGSRRGPRCHADVRAS